MNFATIIYLLSAAGLVASIWQLYRSRQVTDVNHRAWMQNNAGGMMFIILAVILYVEADRGDAVVMTVLFLVAGLMGLILLQRSFRAQQRFKREPHHR